MKHKLHKGIPAKPAFHKGKIPIFSTGNFKRKLRSTAAESTSDPAVEFHWTKSCFQWKQAPLTGFLALPGHV